MMIPAFTQGLYGRLREQAGAEWQRYVAHPFLNQLSAGTLPQAAFRRYLTQDYLFLIHFARSYALLVSKLRTLPEMRAAAASMNAILGELPLHVGYCAEWGLNEDMMARESEAMETVNYTRYVLDIGHSGDALDLLAALLPCVAGYAEIGLGLLHNPHTAMKTIYKVSTRRSACWNPSGNSAARNQDLPSSAKFSLPRLAWKVTSGRWG